MTQTTTPSVYVGTYAKYNNGSLKGEWVDLTQFSTYAEFIEYCQELHNDESDAELMFQDFEGFPKQYYNESSLDEELWEYISLISEDEDRAEAITDYLENGCSLSDFEEAYAGHYNTKNDFAFEIADEMIPRDAPEFLKTYFDYDSFARDLFISDYWMSNNGYVFRNM